jgi:hypothetical protein
MDPARFKRKWHRSRQHSAAVGRGIDRVFVGLELCKQKIKCNARHRTLAHDAHFAGERMCAAQTIDLPFVWRPHGRQQHFVSQSSV